MDTIKQIRTKDLPLQEGFECSFQLALVEGKKGYIITENDLVHAVFVSEEENIKIPISKKGEFSLGYSVEVPIKYLKENFLGEDVDIKTWVHYFGIKGRVANNYSIFKKSCTEIKAKLNFPEWEK
jgi:hypothetical protein